MAYKFAAIPSTDAVGIGDALLATIANVSTPPADARPLALKVAEIVPQLTADARLANDTLVNTLGVRDGAVSTRGAGVQSALEVEKDADRLVSALHGRLESLAKTGVVGGAALLQYLYPAGLTALTRVTGRPQRARYDQWRASWAGRPAQGSAADLDIAAALAAVEAAVLRFGATLDGKDTVAQTADGAIELALDTREAWNATMQDLVSAIEIVQAAAPERFQAWIAPYLQWRRAQESRTTRANGTTADAPQPAPDPADGAGEGGDGGGTIVG